LQIGPQVPTTSNLDMERASYGRYEIGKVRKKEKKKEANRKDNQTQIIHTIYIQVYTYIV